MTICAYELQVTPLASACIWFYLTAFASYDDIAVKQDKKIFERNSLPSVYIHDIN
jgi:hypothetical protein